MIMNSWDNPISKRAVVSNDYWLLVWGSQTKNHALKYMGMPENKVIEFDPFPHILIKNIFDQEFYNQLIANFPEHKYLKKYSSKHGNQKHFKYSLSSKNNTDDLKNS